jgi:gluconolactonase
VAASKPVGLGEGPVWVGGDDGYLIFSSVEDNEILKWSAADGVTTFRKPSNRTNGNALDQQGRLISCEMGGRRVVRTERDGKITVLADRFEGQRLNSPNDLAVKSDGTIWFSDPPYGVTPKTKELAGNYLFRLDPQSGKLDVVVKDRDVPNGVVFSPDEKTLYLTDSWKGRWIWAYDVGADNSLANGRHFAQIDTGISDGLTVDAEGNVYSSAPDGVQIFDPAGKRIGKIVLPHKGVNVEFGGAGRRTLFVTTRGPLYRIDLKARGSAPVQPQP